MIEFLRKIDCDKRGWPEFAELIRVPICDCFEENIPGLVSVYRNKRKLKPANSVPSIFPRKRAETSRSTNERRNLKGELKPEISLLHMKVLTLIKAKSNVFL